ncbi:MAG: hypothetical protein ACRDZ1_02875 [Acidimicrobiia bacterium]
MPLSRWDRVVLAILLVGGILHGLVYVVAIPPGSGLVVGLWLGNTRGLVHPKGRVLLPALPPVAALFAAGWHRCLAPGRRRAPCRRGDVGRVPRRVAPAVPPSRRPLTREIVPRPC